jgi:hypothetical protein
LFNLKCIFTCILFAGVYLVAVCPVSAQEADTASVKPLAKTHNPRRAVIMSAIIPGLGQAYNKKYWKVPIIYGAGGAFVHFLGYYQDKYTKFRTALATGEAGQKYVIDGREYDFESLKTGQDYYRRYRDLNALGIAAIYFLNIVDAMIDANFFYYDVSDNLTMHVQPAVFNNPGATSSLGLQINLLF